MPDPLAFLVTSVVVPAITAVVVTRLVWAHLNRKRDR